MAHNKVGCASTDADTGKHKYKEQITKYARKFLSFFVDVHRLWPKIPVLMRRKHAVFMIFFELLDQHIFSGIVVARNFGLWRSSGYLLQQ
jgi:hypothetical protein